jgi:hypothetical protein
VGGRWGGAQGQHRVWVRCASTPGRAGASQLTCNVPQLQAHTPAAHLKLAVVKVHANGWLVGLGEGVSNASLDDGGLASGLQWGEGRRGEVGEWEG